MPVSHEIERLAVSHSSASEIKRVAVDEGMQELRTDGLRKALEGHTAVAEVLRVAI
jgi:general secretion pathway protein E